MLKGNKRLLDPIHSDSNKIKHTHTNYRGCWSGSLNISLDLAVPWSTPHTLQGLLDRVEAQQDAGLLLDYTH